MQRTAGPGRSRRASISLNVRLTSDRSDARHVPMGIICCCQPAITTFRKLELTSGVCGTRGIYIQGIMYVIFAQFGLKERIPRINGPMHCSSLISLMSVHHCASILKVRLGACWNCILIQSVNFTVFLITTPRHSILSSSILFCPIIIPCCSRLHGNPF
jgi:hypothetical protein